LGEVLLQPTRLYGQPILGGLKAGLPFGTRVLVTNLSTGRSVMVRINDRGPFIRGRVIDLSAGAAKAIGVYGRGTAPVALEVIRD
ncbi:MAG: septal ring lytic transglycosylase RlpA family protein, partial [Microcystaceae cyanobacterium]